MPSDEENVWSLEESVILKGYGLFYIGKEIKDYGYSTEMRQMWMFI